MMVGIHFKKILFLVLILSILSTSVFSAYDPKLDADWGDFTEARTATFNINDATEYLVAGVNSKESRFRVMGSYLGDSISSNQMQKLGLSHTFKAGFTQADNTKPLDSPTKIRAFIDNIEVMGGTTTSSDSTSTYTFTKVINKVSINFEVTGDWLTTKYSVKLSTEGIEKKDLVSAIGPSNLNSAYGEYYKVLAGGGTLNYNLFTATGSPTIPLTLVYTGAASLAPGQPQSFLLALGHYANEATVKTNKANSVAISLVNVGTEREVVVSDNLGNGYKVKLKVFNYKTINKIPLVYFKVLGSPAEKVPVINLIFSGKDFSQKSTSVEAAFADSSVNKIWYGKLMVGTKAYYVRQVYDSKSSEFVLRIVPETDISVGSGDISSYPIVVKFPQPGTTTPTSDLAGKTALGKSVAFSLINQNSVSSINQNSVSSKVYFVPVDLKTDGTIKFFIGGEDAYKKAFPSVQLVDVGVKSPSGTPGIGLPGQQLPSTTVESPSLPSVMGGLAGDLNGDGTVNGADVSWIKINPAKMWSDKLKSNIFSLNALVKSMSNNWGLSSPNTADVRSTEPTTVGGVGR